MTGEHQMKHFRYHETSKEPSRPAVAKPAGLGLQTGRVYSPRITFHL